MLFSNRRSVAIKNLSWNVRCLGQPQTIRYLKNSLRQAQLQLLFLIETKVNTRRMKKIRRKCGFLNGIDVDVEGLRGRLSLGWKEELSVMLKNFSKHHRDIIVNDGIEEDSWRYTGFYGSPVENLRKESWNLLRQLKGDDQRPWLVMGDLNEIMFSFEKKEGRPREECQTSAFREALEDCDLNELGFVGKQFTWERGRLPENNIREKLDKGVANSTWWTPFPTYSARHLSHSISDHCLVLMDTRNEKQELITQEGYTFRFDADWILEEHFEDHVKPGWKLDETDLHFKLGELGKHLCSWVKDNRGRRLKRKDYLKSRLDKLKKEDPLEDMLENIMEVKLMLNMEANKKELFWEQRARTNWIHMGDRNTSFFQKSTTQRRQRNMIKKLEDGNGYMVEGDIGLLSLASSFFKDLFASKPIQNSSNLMSEIRSCLSKDLNEELMEKFNAEEVLEAIKSMALLKASGIDGFTALFFQKYWHIVGRDVSPFCLEFFNGHMELHEINKTNIVILPKVSEPKK